MLLTLGELCGEVGDGMKGFTARRYPARRPTVLSWPSCSSVRAPPAISSTSCIRLASGALHLLLASEPVEGRGHTLVRPDCSHGGPPTTWPPKGSQRYESSTSLLLRHSINLE